MITASKSGKPNEINDVDVDKDEKKPASFWKKIK